MCLSDTADSRDNGADSGANRLIRLSVTQSVCSKTDGSVNHSVYSFIRTYADNVVLPAFARRTLLLCAVLQSIAACCGRTHSSKPAVCGQFASSWCCFYERVKVEPAHSDMAASQTLTAAILLLLFF